MNNKNKVLHYIPGFKFGGIESRTLDILKRIDKSKYQFDFLILTRVDNSVVYEIQKYGGNIYRIPPFTPRTIISYIREMKNIIDVYTKIDLHIHSELSKSVDGDLVKGNTLANSDVLLSKLNNNKVKQIPKRKSRQIILIILQIEL